MALSLARTFNSKLMHLNDKWNNFSDMIQRNFHDDDLHPCASSDGDGDVRPKKQHCRRRRRSGSSAAGGDPKEFDMLVLKTVDWDDNDSY